MSKNKPPRKPQYKITTVLPGDQSERFDRLVPLGMRSRMVSAVIRRLMDAVETGGAPMLAAIVYERFEIVKRED